MRDQAERFGARFLTDNATRFEPAAEEGGLHTVWVGDDEYKARTVILAMGAEHRKLGRARRGGAGQRPRRLVLRDLRRRVLQGQGDDHRRRRRLGDGGGDLPRQVRLQGHDRAPARRVPRVADHVRPRQGDREHRAADARTSSRSSCPARTACSARRACATSRPARSATLPMAGAFVAVGHVPQSEIVQGVVDDRRERLRRSSTAAPRGTDVPGVFAAGDLVDHTYRQAVTAAGTGLPGGARRRVVPARQPARADAGRARGHRRPRRGAVVPPRAGRALLARAARLSRRAACSSR